MIPQVLDNSTFFYSQLDKRIDSISGELWSGKTSKRKTGITSNRKSCSISMFTLLNIWNRGDESFAPRIIL